MISNTHKLLFLQDFNTNDVISTFLYASAVHVILADGVKLTNINIFVAFGLIIFIFIDWLSRITIPISFPPDRKSVV